MPRFYIPPHAWNPDKLALDDGETRHALQVLRMKAGDRATVFNGQGVEATVEFAQVEKGRVNLRKIQAGKTAPLACEITLGQAVPKGKNMDLIVEKATELGAASIVPVVFVPSTSVPTSKARRLLPARWLRRTSTPTLSPGTGAASVELPATSFGPLRPAARRSAALLPTPTTPRAGWRRPRRIRGTWNR